MSNESGFSESSSSEPSPSEPSPSESSSIFTNFINWEYFRVFCFALLIGIGILIVGIIIYRSNYNPVTLIDFKKSNKMINSPTSKVGPSSKSPSCNIIYNSSDISGSCISSNLYTINTGGSDNYNINIPQGNSSCTFTCNSGIINNNDNSDYTLDTENPNLLNFNCGYEGAPVKDYNFICTPSTDTDQSPSPPPSPPSQSQGGGG